MLCTVRRAGAIHNMLQKTQQRRLCAAKAQRKG
nr:MAG TPA: hypothetical protein [Caudoviricetes sp.]